MKRQGKQIYEPQKPPPRPLSSAGADLVRVERSAPGFARPPQPPGAPFAPTSRRAAPARAGAPAAVRPGLAAAACATVPEARARHRLGSPAPTQLPRLRQSGVGLPGPSRLTGSASHALGSHSSHVFPLKAGFLVLFYFFVSSDQTFALPRPFIARYLREGDRELEDLSGAGGGGLPQGYPRGCSLGE